LSGTLLVAVGGNTLTLIPLYAIGVFTGFTLSQGGLVVRWRRTRPPRWRYRASLNGLGAAVTAVATVVFLATKFTEGAWVVVLALPAFIMLFTRIHRYYDQAGRALGIGRIPGKPQARPTAVVVPVTGVSRLAQYGISAALSISEHVEAVTVVRSGADEESERVRELQRQWTRWDPGVPLTRELRYRPGVIVARVPVRVHVHGRAAPLRIPVTRSRAQAKASRGRYQPGGCARP
jgi:hypothetical protein